MRAYLKEKELDVNPDDLLLEIERVEKEPEENLLQPKQKNDSKGKNQLSEREGKKMNTKKSLD